jgi:hypothetical protein
MSDLSFLLYLSPAAMPVSGPSPERRSSAACVQEEMIGQPLLNIDNEHTGVMSLRS